MEEKKNNKKVIIIVAVVLLIVILGTVGGYFGYKYWESNQTVGTEWGDTYYSNLNEKIENGEYSDATNEKMEFVQLEENQTPAMILNYENNSNKIMEISVIDGENVVKTKKYQVESNEELSLDMLYNIETQEYNWFKHEIKTDGTENFTQLTQNDIEQELEATEDKKFEFKAEEMIEEEVQEGEIPAISKFDEKFVEPEVERKEIEVDLSSEIEEKEFKEKVSEAVKEFEENNSKTTEEAKEKTNEKLQELETKKEEIKKAEEEKARLEEEARKKAEEEAKKAAEEAAKKAAEEAAKGLKVGSNTVKYGTYKGKDAATGETLILKSDGTAIYNGKTYKLTVGKDDFAQDISTAGHLKDAIILKSSSGELGLSLFVSSDGTLSDGDINNYTYSGN